MIPKRCSKCDKIIGDKNFAYNEYLGNEQWSFWCADCYLKKLEIEEQKMCNNIIESFKSFPVHSNCNCEKCLAYRRAVRKKQKRELYEEMAKKQGKTE
jgi:hypothetical protein